MAINDNDNYTLTGAQVKDLASKINDKADSSSLATVATTGAYSDLSGTPTIPDAATVIYMVKTVYSGSHDYTVVFYTDLAHTTTISYSDVNYDVVEGKAVYIVDGGNASGSPLSAISGSPKGSGDMNAVVDNSLYKFSIVSGTTYLDVQGIIHADPIQSTAALTPLVQTNMIANGAVTYDKLDATTMKTSATTLWSGTLYQTGSSHAVTLSEALVAGDVYVITAYGLSSSYLMEFVCTYRNNYYQAMYYDGSNYCRWRINFTNNGTKMELDSASTNMGTNTAIIRIAKIGLSSTS